MRKMEQIASVRAAEARRSLGVSASEPVDVIKLLREYRDISFVLRPFVSDISGMFVRADRAEVIAINTARSLGHQRFTAAHEYFHLLYDEGMLGAACKVGVVQTSRLCERLRQMLLQLTSSCQVRELARALWRAQAASAVLPWRMSSTWSSISE
jgi:hypothetical protein